MPDGTTYELYYSRQGDTGQTHARSRIFLINYPMHQAILGGEMLTTIPRLGDPFIFDTGTLYCGDRTAEATSHPDWTTIYARYVRIGELRYAKLPNEPGYRSLSTTSGSNDVTTPYVQEFAGASPGVFEYVTTNVTFKRRDTVALVTVNVLTSAYTSMAMKELKGALNKFVDVSEDDGPWLFESFTTNELADRVTQIVCAFRSSSTLEARPADESEGAFDVDIPELPPFGRYIVRPGPEEDFGGSVGRVRTKPTIITTSDYSPILLTPEIFGPTGFGILPIFQE